MSGSNPQKQSDEFQAKTNQLEPGSVPMPAIVPTLPSKSVVEPDLMSRAFELAHSDPAKAFALIQSSVPRNIVQAAKAELAVRLGLESFANLPLVLGFLSDPAVRADALKTVAADWTKRDPQGIFAFAMTGLNAPDRIIAYMTIAGQLAEISHFEDAAAVIDQMPEGSSSRQNTIFKILGGWARSDPQASVHWMLTLSSQEQSLAADLLLSSLKKPEGLDSILQFVEAQSDPSIQNRGIARAIDVLVDASDLQAAQSWIEQLPQGFRPAAQAELIARDTSDSVASLTPLALEILDPTEREKAAHVLVSRLFARNPTDAAQWVAKLPVGQQADSTENLAIQWYQTDPMGAYRWLQSLPKGVSKDQGLRAYVSIATAGNPDMAGDAASQIGK